MERPKGFATFEKRGEYNYRTSAYLQFGHSSKSIGCCLLLNPGAAVFINQRISEAGQETGEVSLDPTMKQLVSLLHEIYQDCSIEGRFYIYNLFPLQDTDAERAIGTIERLLRSGELLIEQCLVPVSELQEHPWVLLGWGLAYRKEWVLFAELKKRWMEVIRQAAIPSFGKRHSKRGDYYHPCPQIPTKRPQIIKELTQIYIDTIK